MIQTLMSSLLLMTLACQAAPAAQDAPTVVTRTHSGTQHGSAGNGPTMISVHETDKGALALTLQRDGSLSATLDGVAVPAERLVRDGDRLSVLDASGGTVYEIKVLADNRGLAYPYGDEGEYARFLTHWFPDGDDGQGLWSGRVRVAGQPRRVIGVVTTPVDGALAAQLDLQPESALIVNEISPGMPAEKAGLQAFDVIVRIEGQGPVTRARLRECIVAKEPGQTVQLSLLRRGQPLELDVEVTETTDDSFGMARYLDTTSAGGADAQVWSTLNLMGESGRGNQALEQARAELEAARSTLVSRLADLEAASAASQAAGTDQAAGAEGREKARAELLLALGQLTQASERLAEHDAATAPEVRFFDVGQGGDRGMLLRSPQWLKTPAPPAPPAPPAAPGWGDAASAADVRLKQMEERLAQLDQRVAELLQRLEAAGSKP